MPDGVVRYRLLLARIRAIVYISGSSQFSARTVIFTIGFLALLVTPGDIRMRCRQPFPGLTTA
jgi:hypothetical protein